MRCLPKPGFDLEAKTLVDMLARGQWLPSEVTGIERRVRDRMAQVEAGLSFAPAPRWTVKLQHEIDELLRLRWDFLHGWVVERAVAEWGCWAICGVIGQRQIPYNLIDILHAGDMQRIGPDNYLRQKRAAAEQVRQSKESATTDKVLGAVDRMSEAGIKNFIAVERAIHTGDTIVAHGETEKMLDRMTQASFRAEQQSDLHDEKQAFNPQDHPLRRVRPKGGPHVRSARMEPKP
jgi:hypothetical protein